ncbi:MAG: hypothetical protein R6V06_03340 [Kiritimatiellia bacterium]
MNINMVNGFSIVMACFAVAVAGCGRNAENEGVGERTGAALDRAAENTADAAQATGEEIKETTGEVLESTGAAVENAGDNMQK